MNGIILDIILVVLLIIFALIGFYKGFLREFISLGGFFGSLAIIYFVHQPFASLLNTLFGWGTRISGYIMGQVTQISPAFGTDKAGTVDELQQIIDGSGGVGVGYTSILKQIVKKAQIPAGQTISVSQAVGGVVSGLAMTVIAAVFLFISLKIVVFILDKVFSAIPRKSAVGVANKWLGLFLGTAKGFLSAGIIILLVYFACLIPSVNNFVYPYIESSYVVKHVYNYLGNYILGTA